MEKIKESQLKGDNRLRRTIEDIDSVALKYNGSFPVHDAVAANDLQAVLVLTQRRHLDSYDKSGRTPIHIAALKGYDEVIKALLKFDADINGPERSTGRTALHFASLAGHKKTVEVLLKKGAVLFDQDRTGAYPIHLAAEGGYADVIICLKNAGASVSVRDKENAVPIHYAAKHNRLSVLTALHQLGADTESTDKNGATPLHYAALENNCEAIRRLSDLGANIDSKCNLGETPLTYATRSANLDAITSLASLKCDLNTRNNEGECAIHIAAKLDVWQSVHQLVKVGVDVTTIHKNKKQAIHIAAEHGSCESIKQLKKHKADLNAISKRGYRPIHCAVVTEQFASIQKLVELGADINAPKSRGQTALHVAVKQKRVKVVNLLCSLGADCNAENECLLVPLYYAAVNEDMVTGQILRRYGAQLNGLNSEGEGIVHVLVECEMLQGLTTLRDFKANFACRNKDGDTCVHIAAAEMQVDVLKHLKNIGVDLNMRNKYGLSALHVAVIEGKGETVDLFNDLGADLDASTEDYKRDGTTQKLDKMLWFPADVDREEMWKYRVGMSACHLALLSGHQDILAHLVECGAYVNQSNSNGETVFHLAVLFNMTDWLQALMSLGADRNCKDNLGRSPLHYAAHTGSMACLRFLLKYGAIITETDNEGRQPLHYAAQEGHYLLLPEFTAQNRAVDLNCLDNSGRTPLHFACENGKVDTIKELVQLKADVDTKDQNGNTVIHSAAAHGAHETIVLLASFGCSMDVQNKDLQTPLHVAAERGQGEAMEYLLMCGCNPNLKDKNELCPNPYKLRGQVKQDVVRRIRQYNEHHTAEHKTGEVCFDSKTVPVGRPTDFVKLGVRVTLECDKDVAPIIFFHRTPPDAKQLGIPLRGLEEILSDVYEIRVLCLETVCSLVVEIPMDGFPGKFESFLRTTTSEEYKSFTTSEENGVPLFVGKIPVGKSFISKFAVLVRPGIVQYNIGQEGGTIISELDRRIRLEVPSGAFKDNTCVNLQVLRTFATERSSEQLFASDVVSTNASGVQPHKKLTLQLPLYTRDVTIEEGVEEDIEDIAVFAIPSEHDLQDEHRWQLLQSHLKYINGCITFTIDHCSIYVASFMSARERNIDVRKLRLKDKMRLALQRETSVLFFCAVFRRKDRFLTILECTIPGKFKRRSEYWEKEGFHLHPVIRHSGHFVARPNQQYNFSVTGNFQHMSENMSKMTLNFNPRSYKYQSFYLQAVEKRQPMIGSLQITTPGTEGDDDFVTSLPLEVPKNSLCKLS